MAQKSFTVRRPVRLALILSFGLSLLCAFGVCIGVSLDSSLPVPGVGQWLLAIALYPALLVLLVIGVLLTRRPMLIFGSVLPGFVITAIAVQRVLRAPNMESMGLSSRIATTASCLNVGVFVIAAGWGWLGYLIHRAKFQQTSGDKPIRAK
jgi:hypothetical protein